MNRFIPWLARALVFTFPLVLVWHPLWQLFHGGGAGVLAEQVLRWHYVFLTLCCVVIGASLKRSSPGVWWLALVGALWLLEPFVDAMLAGRWPYMAWLRQAVLPWLVVFLALLPHRSLRPF